MPTLFSQLETHTVALNRSLYAEGVGLLADDSTAPTEALLPLYSALLVEAEDPATRYCALENWAELRLAALDQQLTHQRDEHLSLPGLECAEGPVTWRNWKTFERETNEATRLQDVFQQWIDRSLALTPLFAQRLTQQRDDFAPHRLTPLHTFCWREGLTPEALRALLLTVGTACRAPFQHALKEMSQRVFGRLAGPAELHALYLNRMYEPLTALFAVSNKDWVADTQVAFARLSFNLSAVPVDVESRRLKYPGAFCFPVAVPEDVRVSVRMASPHHLVDMLYHEFGHAAHFSGIRADLAFVDRYWIHSGTHETFSTLFEFLLGERAFVQTQFGFDEAAVTELLSFHRFKNLIVGTWLNAAALTALDTWLEDLAWPQVEARYAEHFLNFTGVAMPPGFARLEPFVSTASIYPAGYVLAAVRVTHWLAHLRAAHGAAWWSAPAAQAEIRARIAVGGQVQFSADWLNPEPFLQLIGAR